MSLRKLKNPSQIESWLKEWGSQLTEPGSMVLMGSGALLWHVAQRNLELPLSENSMDVNPVTESEQMALLGYEAHWLNPEHPCSERFLGKRALVERILESPLLDEQLDRQLHFEGHSLRSLIREIPTIFGSI